MMRQATRVLGWLLGAARRLSRRIAVARDDSARVRYRLAVASAQADDYEALGWR